MLNHRALEALIRVALELARLKAANNREPTAELEIKALRQVHALLKERVSGNPKYETLLQAVDSIVSNCKEQGGEAREGHTAKA